ncbi:MAG: PAS domain S-box protein [Desulfobacter sp.]|nr:MAG: PAS domain S-box protein [Desulfobacter sp.]
MKPLSFKRIEKDFFKGKNPLKQLLAISLDLLGARHSGLLYGTDESQMRFLPSSSWDRGIMDRFDGKGAAGLILRFLGTYIVTARKLSPVFFYKKDANGQLEDNHGIIAYVLRNCADYYRKGINVVICPDTDPVLNNFKDMGGYCQIPFFIYNGNRISRPKNHIKVDTRIVKHFNSSNSIYIILPDYGILVINTADPQLLKVQEGTFIREKDLRQRLDILIRMVKTSSLAYLERLKGQGAQLLWHKEAHLRKAYADLSKNEKKFRDLYEHAPIAYFYLDAHGLIYRCNRQAEQLSGFDRKTLIGRSAYQLFSDSVTGDLGFKTIWKRLEKGSRVKDLELCLIHKKGGLVWTSLSVDAIRDEQGEIRKMRAMAVDISKRKTLEKQLYYAQKMEAIGTLARGIAHDFNNVLSPVSGYAQIMLMDQDRDPQEKDRIQVILDCTRHAKDLVSQILTFSRQKAHQFMPIKAGNAVEESMVLVRSFLPSSVKIQARIDLDCGYIMADPVQVHQVIMNLATNAYHAMETGGCLEVALFRQKILDDTQGIAQGSYVCLSISDTGQGIDPAVLPQIFEPYFTTKKDGRGSGIGLSVVLGIVKDHGGDILVESRLGQGTHFKLYFPVCPKQGEAWEAEPKALNLVKGTESVLLVDDEPKVALMHTQLLERLGYRVVCFSTGKDALIAYGLNPGGFDLVITDFTMPDMDGGQLAKEIWGMFRILCHGFGSRICLSASGSKSQVREWAFNQPRRRS